MRTIKQFVAGVAVAIAASICLSSYSFASSVLIDKGDYTVDPATKLQWLDVTKTQGLSYSDVLGNKGVSYAVQGWRYATASEFTSLITDAGLAIGGYCNGCGFFPNMPPELAAFQNLLGLTDIYAPTDSYDTYGMLTDFSSGTLRLNYGEVARSFWNTVGMARIWDFNYPLDYSQSNLGSYLVRSVPVAATPLPPSLWLFVAALGVTGLYGWRSRSKPAHAA
jgi:hypothetical protein